MSEITYKFIFVNLYDLCYINIFIYKIMVDMKVFYYLFMYDVSKNICYSVLI